MKAFSIPLLSLILLFAYCNNPSKQNIPVADTANKITETNNFIDVSMIKLIANPKEYEGHKVRVQGYLSVEYHSSGLHLHLHKEDYEQAIDENALWVSIDVDDNIWPEAVKCRQHYVIIEGTFSTMEGPRNFGSGSFFGSGSIKNIKRIEIWENMGIPPKPKKDQIKFPPPND